MSNIDPETCRQGKRVKLEFENLREATHRREERIDLLNELDRIESNISEEVKRILREESEIRLNDSAQETSEALINWLLIEDDNTTYDYEYIQKMGTLLNTIASEILGIATSRSGISEQNRTIIQQSLKELLKEIFLRKC